MQAAPGSLAAVRPGVSRLEEPRSRTPRDPPRTPAGWKARPRHPAARIPGLSRIPGPAAGAAHDVAPSAQIPGLSRIPGPAAGVAHVAGSPAPWPDPPGPDEFKPVGDVPGLRGPMSSNRSGTSTASGAR